MWFRDTLHHARTHAPTHTPCFSALITAFTTSPAQQVNHQSCQSSTINQCLPLVSTTSAPHPPQPGCVALHLAFKMIQSHSECSYKVAESAFIRKWNLCTYIFFFTSCRTPLHFSAISNVFTHNIWRHAPLTRSYTYKMNHRT